MYCKRLCVVAATAVAFAVAQGGSVLAAGDVTAVLGQITGDKADNQIAAYSDESGTQVWVEGREGTTINGGTEPVSFPAGGMLRIQMGAGNDAVDVRLTPADGIDVYLYIDGGGGDDEVVVEGGKFPWVDIWTDSEYWWIHEGDDEVKIEDVITEYLLLVTGEGKDDVVLRNTQIQGLFPPEGLTSIWLGAGHDQIVIDSIVADYFELVGHSGNDVVELRGNSEAETARIHLGDGSDVLDADASEGASWVGTFGSLLSVYGHNGRDTLINPDYFQTTYVDIDGFEVIDE